MGDPAARRAPFTLDRSESSPLMKSLTDQADENPRALKGRNKPFPLLTSHRRRYPEVPHKMPSQTCSEAANRIREGELTPPDLEFIAQRLCNQHSRSAAERKSNNASAKLSNPSNGRALTRARASGANSPHRSRNC